MQVKFERLLGMIVASMVLQLFLVFVQNTKTPWVMAKEMLIVLMMLKPGFDCYKVVSGQEMDEQHSVDAKTELVAAKAIEMVCESIPGSLLQL